MEELGLWYRMRQMCYETLGFPRPHVLDRQLHWLNEQHFALMLRFGRPIVVTMVVPGCAFSEPFKDVLREAAAQFHEDGIRFMLVDCSKAEKFCASRQPESFPHVEVYVPRQEAKPDGTAANRITIFRYDKHRSIYGFRTFFREHGLLPPIGPVKPS